MLSELAPAKINLTLRVGPRRSDGYHEIESLVLLVPLGDEVRVARRADACLSLACDEPGVPVDDTNLALRAAVALRETLGERGRTLGAHITLRKHIPTGMGLGGGSSDAAATLRLLNRLWQAGQTDTQLAKLGAHLGSDVPLFFHGPLALVRGRGELVERLDLRPSGAVLLILPPLHVPTPACYRAFDELPQPPLRPDLGELARCAAREAALSGAAPPTLNVARLNRTLFNDLMPAAFRVEPRLAELHHQLAPACSAPLHMTGSGAGLFCLLEDEQRATSAADTLRTSLEAAGNARGIRLMTLAANIPSA